MGNNNFTEIKVNVIGRQTRTNENLTCRTDRKKILKNDFFEDNYPVLNKYQECVRHCGQKLSPSPTCTAGLSRLA